MQNISEGVTPELGAKLRKSMLNPRRFSDILVENILEKRDADFVVKQLEMKDPRYLLQAPEQNERSKRAFSYGIIYSMIAVGTMAVSKVMGLDGLALIGIFAGMIAVSNGFFLTLGCLVRSNIKDLIEKEIVRN
jgi:hypothetical protein